MNARELKHEALLMEWREKIVACRSSGQTVRQWCREQGFTEKTYYRWEREIFGQLGKKGKESQALAVAAPEFAAAPAIKSCGASGQAIMTVRTGAAEVDIYAGAGEQEIEAVLRVLKQC